MVTGAAGGAAAETMARTAQERRDATQDGAGAASIEHEKDSDTVEDADSPDEHVPLGDDDDSVVNGSDGGGAPAAAGAQMPTRSDRLVDEVRTWTPLTACS